MTLDEFLSQNFETPTEKKMARMIRLAREQRNGYLIAWCEYQNECEKNMSEDDAELMAILEGE